jgi:ribosome-binding protein aMBF1 (putative translation factor)
MSNIINNDDNIFAGRHMRDAQAKWDRLSMSDLAQIKTKAQLIARVEERYVLPHEVAAQDVEIWGLNRRF